jgi:hypothetical protein
VLDEPPVRAVAVDVGVVDERVCQGEREVAVVGQDC